MRRTSILAVRVEGARASARVSEALWTCSFEAYAVAALHPEERAEVATLADRLRRLPRTTPCCQLARQNLAATIKALGDLAGARALEEQVLDVSSRTP